MAEIARRLLGVQREELRQRANELRVPVHFGFFSDAIRALSMLREGSRNSAA
jgi:hypothetical protein